MVDQKRRSKRLFWKLCLVLGWLFCAVLSSWTEFPAQGAVNDLLLMPAEKSDRASNSILMDVKKVGGHLVAVGEWGHILFSDEACTGWTQADVPVSVTLTAVCFPTDKKGWAVGHEGVVLYTHDGGKTWEKQLDGVKINDLLYNQLERMIKDKTEFLENAGTGLTEQERKGLELKLEDLGYFLSDAKMAVEEGPSRPLMDVWFKNDREGIIIGAFGTILSTVDGGRNWTPLLDRIENPDGYHYYSIFRSGENLFIAGESGGLYRSQNFGQTWKQLSVPYNGSFFGITGNPEGDFVAVFGLRGNICFSLDGGENWQQTSIGEVSLSGGVWLEEGSFCLTGVDGSTRVLLFFIIAFSVLLFLLWFNCRCIKSTAMRAISSIAAVIWQLGIMKLFGYGLNPYSMLVPFLMFALGVSHGIQMFNAQAQEMIAGADKLKAARLAYRQNYIPGLAALFTDSVGFALLLVIRIGVIQDIAVGATIGVAVVAITDLMFLPVLMSYSGISPKTIELVKKRMAGTNHPVWSFLSKFASRKYATVAIVFAVIGLGGGIYKSQDLKIGDLDPGAPELRPDSRYNKDNAYMNAHYSTSSDVFVVMLKTPHAGNSEYSVVVATDKLKKKLTHLKGVQNVLSHVDFLKHLNSAFMEGNLKWTALPRSKVALDQMVLKIPPNFMPLDSNITPMMVFLDDHKAETLKRVVSAIEEFATEHNTKDVQFLMAAGNAGIEAATNIEVEKALIMLTLLVYAAVFLTCLITYRNFKAAVCVVTPLALTSVLCEAVMAITGIGVKVATLPVIAVGVGIGVDYGIYIYNKLSYYRNTKGYSLSSAYYRTLNTTGRAVSFTGITLSIGVATWAFSPIKFQADMGFLLTFMFLWNMVGAMVLLPALVHFLMNDKKNF